MNNVVWKVTSQNVKGLNNLIKRKRALKHLSQTNSEVLLLQETHLHSKNQPELKANWIQYQFHAKGNSKSRGVAILLTHKVRFQLKATLADHSGRYIFIKGLLNEELVTIASVYAPNESQLSFIRDTLTTLETFHEGDIILGGDLNLIIDPETDRSSTQRKKSPETQSINRTEGIIATTQSDRYLETHTLS